MARPSEYDFEMCKAICIEVADGFNIKTVLKSKPEYPDFTTFCRWKREHEELRNLYVNAQQDKAESEIEEIEHVYDMLKAGELEPSVANVLIQTKKWTASKYYPKMYGTKQDVHEKDEEEDFGNNAKNVNVTIQIKDYSKPNEPTES